MTNVWKEVMGEIEKLKSFLDCIQYREKQLISIDPTKGRFPFVTISRETGAGGHNLADKILELIGKESREPIFQGWQCCDQELCLRIAEDPRFKGALDGLIASEYHSQAEDLISQLLTGAPPQDLAIKKMFRMIRNLALFGKTIFVGRGSACLTRDLPYGVHVRLVASMPSRVSLMMKSHGQDEKWAVEKIREQDKAKATLVKTFFHKDIHDPLLYDAIWNTDRVEIDEVARVIVDMIRKKAGNHK